MENETTPVVATTNSTLTDLVKKETIGVLITVALTVALPAGIKFAAKKVREKRAAKKDGVIDTTATEN